MHSVQVLVVLLYVFLSNITKPMQIDQLEDTVPPPNQNNVAVCTQITLLIVIPRTA